jgi:hypothetical protein
MPRPTSGASPRCRNDATVFYVKALRDATLGHGSNKAAACDRNHCAPFLAINHHDRLAAVGKTHARGARIA